jgi:hypothetical protein
VASLSLHIEREMIGGSSDLTLGKLVHCGCIDEVACMIGTKVQHLEVCPT